MELSKAMLAESVGSCLTYILLLHKLETRQFSCFTGHLLWLCTVQEDPTEGTWGASCVGISLCALQWHFFIIAVSLSGACGEQSDPFMSKRKDELDDELLSGMRRRRSYLAPDNFD